ncbi:MAG: c-type cytochrome [Bdellovibrionaceae bacterium]|jgi:cytochrome c553|nr:c-type cytochrome [Pseudobdellovibrionaceae bacterium]
MKSTLGCMLFILFMRNVFAAPSMTGEQIFKRQCASCHSQNANDTNIPILFGQEQRYIVKALNKFKADERTDHILGSMKSMAMHLSDDDINAIAKYVSTKDICSVKQNIDTKKEGFIEAFRAGRAIEKKINCQHCHGSFHRGAPRFYGQRKRFLKLTLHAFQGGRRDFPIMKRVTSQLSNEDIENLSTYINAMVLMRDCK